MASVLLGQRHHPTGTVFRGPAAKRNRLQIPLATPGPSSPEAVQGPHGHGEPELHRPRPVLQLCQALCDANRIRPRVPATGDHLDQPPRVAKHPAPRIHVLRVACPHSAAPADAELPAWSSPKNEPHPPSPTGHHPSMPSERATAPKSPPWLRIRTIFPTSPRPRQPPRRPTLPLARVEAQAHPTRRP